MNHARVMVIEDELAMRTAVADVLQAEGYRVLTAADGEAGLQRRRHGGTRDYAVRAAASGSTRRAGR